VWQCSPGNNSHITNIAIFLYLALVQVAAIVLAIQTRRVKVKLLNDSKYIVALIYISGVVLLLLIVVTFILGVLINVNEILVSGAFLVSTTAFLSLTFIPKVTLLDFI
jgi:gamma-aminobutyric acid type B receptor